MQKKCSLLRVELNFEVQEQVNILRGKGGRLLPKHIALLNYVQTIPSSDVLSCTGENRLFSPELAKAVRSCEDLGPILLDLGPNPFEGKNNIIYSFVNVVPID